MRFPWPIRYTVPALLFLLGCFLCWITYQAGMEDQGKRIERQMAETARDGGQKARILVEHYFAKHDVEGLVMALRSATTSPHLTHALIADDKGQIFLAKPSPFFGSRLDQAAAKLKGFRDSKPGQSESRVVLSSDGNSMLALYPFRTHTPSAFGMILLRYDLTVLRSRAYVETIQGLGIIAAFWFVLCFLVWLFSHSILTARVGRLLEATRRIARGEYSLPPRLRGCDELAELSRAFENMSRSIQENTAMLRDTNTQMRNEIAERRRVEEALRNSERRFRSVWQNSSDGMRLTDADGTLVAVNAAFCRLVGMAEQELLGRPFTVVYDHSENLDEMILRYKERFQNYKVPERVERRLTFRNEKTVDLEITNCFIELEHESKVLLGIFRDISERKQAERSLMRVMDSQKLESLGVLAGGIAHDFNNLLTAIIGNTSLALMKMPEPSPIRNYLHNIERSSTQAADLCRQMLAYSGRGRFVIEQIDLNMQIRELTQLLEVSIHKKAALKMELGTNLPSVEADATQIRQVVMNLVINASEAVAEKQGTIIIRTGVMTSPDKNWVGTHLSNELPEGRYVFLEVVDDGIGMSPETKARIFDPFFTTKFAGRGLGLAAVLGIVRGHRGALKVYSELGQGTTFKVLLPASETLAEAAVPRQSPPVQWTGSGTVLVVDDEENIRGVAREMLESLGFEVLTASRGDIGLELFQKHRAEIQMVLLDMTMPKWNGEETFREIRKVDSTARVVLMSGYSEEDATHKFSDSGLSGFLQKPFSLSELQERLKSLLGTSVPLVHA